MIVSDAVKYSKKDATDSEIIEFIRTWLSNAEDRQGGRKRRRTANLNSSQSSCSSGASGTSRQDSQPDLFVSREPSMPSLE